MNITVKILSGETVSLFMDSFTAKGNIDKTLEEKILQKLNQINPMQYPLKRTKLLKNENKEENKDSSNDSLISFEYYALIDTHLLLSLTHISKVYTAGNGFMINTHPIFPDEQKFKDGMDGISFDEYRGVEDLQIKFEMSNSTMYRLFVVSIINSVKAGPIISYKYDTDSKQEYERIAELLKNKKIKLEEEHIKNVMINLLKGKDDLDEVKNNFKDYIYFRDDTIIVLNCNGDIVYTDHYHWYHYSQHPNWDYYEI